MPTIDPRKMRRKRGWMNLKVDRVVHETHDTDTFYLVDAEEGGRPWDYVAGQYLTFRFDDVAEKPVVRSYTMSSSPIQPEMSAFTVKRVEGGLISNWLCDNVKAGTVLKARGPIGRFYYDPDADHERLIMVAGGSGVTPFISIMREHMASLGKPGSPKEMVLLISYRSKDDLICWEDLEEINSHEGATVITTLTRANEDGFWQGRIDEEMLTKAIDGRYEGSTFMTCGPVPMMDLVVDHGKRNGVAEEHLKTESFES